MQMDRHLFQTFSAHPSRPTGEVKGASSHNPPPPTATTAPVDDGEDRMHAAPPGYPCLEFSSYEGTNNPLG